MSSLPPATLHRNQSGFLPPQIGIEVYQKMPECSACGNNEEFVIDVSVTEVRVFNGPDLVGIERTNSHDDSGYECLECGADGEDIDRC